MKKFICMVTAALCLTALLSSCGASQENEQQEVVNEFQSMVDEKVDFEYDLNNQKVDSPEKFVSTIGEIYSSIPAYESGKTDLKEFVSGYFKIYYTGIDPDSADTVKGDDGRTYAVVSSNRIKSLLFYTFRIEDYTIPTKDENADFYCDGSNVYVVIGEKGDAVYHVSDTVKDDTGATLVFTRIEGKSDVASFKVRIEQDDYGYYVTSVTK